MQDLIDNIFQIMWRADFQLFHLVLQVVGDDLLEAAVQPLSVLVQDHGVSIAVKLLEREARVILPLNLLKTPFSTFLQYFPVGQT